jgi:beta-glucosidase
LMPKPPSVLEALGKRTVDFIGVNYYTKGYVRWHPPIRASKDHPPVDLPVGIEFSRNNELASDLGWAIHPRGFGRMLKFASQYKLPLYITENGIADKKDALRPGYLISHLKEIAQAIQDGVDIRGYYHWSLLDNFEWIKGFGPRFGLYQVDYKTLLRTPTKTAELYKQIIQAHQSQPTGLPDLAVLNSQTR